VRYRFGGRSPRSGFDCSGLVQSVCAKWGIYLPRVAHAQFKMGMPVKLGELEPGDLVFFKNTYKRGISHVGIYIGNNYFIHAARPGQGVCMSRLDKGYHRQHWAGARRLNLSKLPPVPGEEIAPQQVILQDTPDAPAQQITKP
jgi:cell wall-associated NlpC family hydrolase